MKIYFIYSIYLISFLLNFGCIGKGGESTDSNAPRNVPTKMNSQELNDSFNFNFLRVNPSVFLPKGARTAKEALGSYYSGSYTSRWEGVFSNGNLCVKGSPIATTNNSFFVKMPFKPSDYYDANDLKIDFLSLMETPYFEEINLKEFDNFTRDFLDTKKYPGGDIRISFVKSILQGLWLDSKSLIWNSMDCGTQPDFLTANKLHYHLDGIHLGTNALLGVKVTSDSHSFSENDGAMLLFSTDSSLEEAQNIFNQNKVNVEIALFTYGGDESAYLEILKNSKCRSDRVQECRQTIADLLSELTNQPGRLQNDESLLVPVDYSIRKTWIK